MTPVPAWVGEMNRLREMLERRDLQKAAEPVRIHRDPEVHATPEPLAKATARRVNVRRKR